MNILINDYSMVSLMWNLFLLLIPFFLCLGLIRLWQGTAFKKISSKVLAIILFFSWLFMIPNSAYVITDIRHITGFCPVNANRICIENAWNIMFFFCYGLIGWVAFVYFVNQMKYLIADAFGQILAKIYIFAIIPMISIGVLLGLVNRLNTWNLVMDPFYVFGELRLYFTESIYSYNLIAFLISFYILYFVGDLLLKPFLSYGLFKSGKGR